MSKFDDQAEEVCREIYRVIEGTHFMNLPKDRKKDVIRIIKEALKEVHDKAYKEGHEDGYYKALALLNYDVDF
jgi:hypothetical protein